MLVRIVAKRSLLGASIAALVSESVEVPVGSVVAVTSLAAMDPAPQTGDLVVLMADAVPASRMMEAVEALTQDGVRVVLLVDANHGATARRCLASSGHAVLSTSADRSRLHAALAAARAGERYVDPILEHFEHGGGSGRVPSLSQQEIRALVLYANGIKLDTVARRIGVSPTTAREYIERVKRKYAAAGRPLHTKHDLHTAATDDGWLLEET